MNIGQNFKFAAFIQTTLYHDPGIQLANEWHLLNKDRAVHYTRLSGGHVASLPWWKDSTLANNEGSFFFLDSAVVIWLCLFNRGLYKPSAWTHHIYPLCFDENAVIVLVDWWKFFVWAVKPRWLVRFRKTNQCSVNCLLFQGHFVIYQCKEVSFLFLIFLWLTSTLKNHR